MSFVAVADNLPRSIPCKPNAASPCSVISYDSVKFITKGFLAHSRDTVYENEMQIYSLTASKQLGHR